ncbi:MAG: acyl-CoA dehydratase activase [Caldilineaceae bacterium]
METAIADALVLGIDVGSTTVKLVALDPEGHVLAARYARAHGRPRQTLLTEAEALAADLGITLAALVARSVAVGFTGSGGRPVCALLGGVHVNELVAQTCAIGHFHPEVRTIIEIGGQDSKFLSVDWDPLLKRMVLSDMAMNNLCAAGTGAFLDQQAERLGISVENEFAEIALRAEAPARIAGRCTVFATSDMVHLQQIGTPLPEILAGLCLALARNFRAVIGKGKAFRPPIAIQGGVAYNGAVVRAFEQALKLPPGSLLVPTWHHVMAAIGAALNALEQSAAMHRVPFLAGRVGEPGDEPKQRPFVGFGPLHVARSESEYTCDRLPPLSTKGVDLASRPAPFWNGNGHPHRTGHSQGNCDGNAAPSEELYLGIDVGSVTTKVVVLNDKTQVVARRYVRTQGRPLEVVRACLAEVSAELAASPLENPEVRAVGVTGSGRHMTAALVGADVVRSEITAQARAAMAFDPNVDTIFEIGGQDSKYIALRNGVVVDFAMNSACAAGTGAFIEEQAARLCVAVEGEFSHLALHAANPVALGERCTVFMESDLVHHQQQGAGVDDLAAGLAYAIVENYLNRVVGTRTVGEKILFLGGVAWNDSVVAAFHARTGRSIVVPPHHDVSGAVGAALLARDDMLERAQTGIAQNGNVPAPSRFMGFRLEARQDDARPFICQACPNLCEVNRVTFGQDEPVYYGARCDRFDADRVTAPGVADAAPVDLFAKRDLLLYDGYTPGPRKDGRPRIGLPRTLFVHDMFPYWLAFFSELGFDVVLSPPTNPALARLAKEHAIAETCYPVKLVHGHIAHLLESDIDILFLPAITSRERVGERQSENANCPYVRAAGDLAAASLDPAIRQVQVLAPGIHMQWVRYRESDLLAMAPALGASRRRLLAAASAALDAQTLFESRLEKLGANTLAELDPQRPNLVLVGRPYNTVDMGVCQNLPHTLHRLGAQAIPMDLLPVRLVDVPERFASMYWRCGQDILAAGQLILRDPRLHAIYVTSFGCGPDSFIIGYFRRLLAGKPHLELELDEHTADAGVVTRCEAFVESLLAARRARVGGQAEGGRHVQPN